MKIIRKQLNHPNLAILNELRFTCCKYFFLTNLCNGNFLYPPKFFTPTKNFYTVLTPTEMKQNLLRWIFFSKIFVSFVKSRRVWSFSKSFNISFFFHNDRQWAEKTILVLLCRRILNNFVRPQIYSCAGWNLTKD